MNLIILDDLENASAHQNINLKCIYCSKIFSRQKNFIKAYLKHLNSDTQRKDFRFCSRICKNFYTGASLKLNCTTCDKEIRQKKSQIAKAKNHFCSTNCSAIHTNANREISYRRSKLEIWLEERLKLNYPQLEIIYNERKILGGLELDIYIPSLKLAFELNGIFHYEQIYNEKSFNKIQNNDNRKFQKCIEKGISLCVIDISKQKYFKESTSIPFLNIIMDIIRQNLDALRFAFSIVGQ